VTLLRLHLRGGRAWFVCGSGLFGAVMLSLCIGVYPIAPSTVLRILAALSWPGTLPEHPDWSVAEQMVVQAVRLPRVLLATIAGAGLGLTGAALQGLLQNPLVSPDIIGVSAGAACGGVLALLLGLSLYSVVGVAFLGGIAAILATVALVRLSRSSSFAYVLAGIIVSAFFSAALSLMEFVADPLTSLPAIVHWLMGTFAGATALSVGVVGVPTLLAGAIMMGLRWRLNLLSLGDADAASLGINPGRLRATIILLAALIVAAQVAVSGIVGWIGLIVPHLARMLVGPDHRRLLPASAMLGSAFTLVVDDIARSIASQELPIGVLTAIIGTPVFALLFWRIQSKGWIND
jgi:iron complex transport system permease protein